MLLRVWGKLRPFPPDFRASTWGEGSMLDFSLLQGKFCLSSLLSQASVFRGIMPIGCHKCQARELGTPWKKGVWNWAFPPTLASVKIQNWAILEAGAMARRTVASLIPAHPRCDQSLLWLWLSCRIYGGCTCKYRENMLQGTLSLCVCLCEFKAHVLFSTGLLLQIYWLKEKESSTADISLHITPCLIIKIGSSSRKMIPLSSFAFNPFTKTYKIIL